MRCYQERVTATSVHIFVPSMNPGAYALAVIPKTGVLNGSYLSETSDGELAGAIGGTEGCALW